MRTCFYMCLALLVASLSGCFWGPHDGHRGGYGNGHQGTEWHNGR